MNKEEAKEMFDAFLKDNNALEAFYNNPTVCFDEDDFKDMDGIISFAFVWKDSKQGHDFWSCLDNRWREILESITNDE